MADESEGPEALQLRLRAAILAALAESITAQRAVRETYVIRNMLPADIRPKNCTPVREELKRLQAEGLVKRLRASGLHIRWQLVKAP